DDAGTATNASRRASAREKDVGLAEDVNATSSFQQEPSETRTACDTPAMSEDNFDGDSVPSPSAQDVNASTEAILDMIDEIVDGPGAPKRVPLESESVDTLFDELEITSEHSNIIIQESSKTLSDNITSQPAEASPAENAKSDSPLQFGISSQTESSLSDLSPGVLNTDSVDSLPQSSSLPEAGEPAVSTQPEDSALSKVPEVPEASEAPAICPPPNIPSSSEEKTVQNITDSSGECETQERTVKCVSSSDKRDNVTVESAESTSSDSSVSEGKAVFVETPVRSPLKRRLVRPAPSDRRPDSTVSSTVDSQIVHLPTTEQTSSENITKDVTSSSDAVPTLHGNVKPEEIRNVSEINFCKAETSSSPKKIKLIRQKVISGTNNTDNSINQTAIQSDKDQCQSTSSESHSLPLPEPHSESSNNINISQSQDSNEPLIPVANCISEKPVNSPVQTASSDEHSLTRIEHSHSLKLEQVEKHDSNEQIPSGQSTLCLPNALESIKHIVDENNVVKETSSISLPNSASPQAKIIENDLNPDESNVNYDEHKDTKDIESAQNEVLPSLQNTPACTQNFEGSKLECTNSTAENHTITQDCEKSQGHTEGHHHRNDQNEIQMDDHTQVEDQKKQEHEMQVEEHLERQDHTQALDHTQGKDDRQLEEHTEKQDHTQVQNQTTQENNMETPPPDHTSDPVSIQMQDKIQMSEPKHVQEDEKKVPPIKLNLSMANLSESNKETDHSSISKTNAIHEESEITKQVPKLTIKLKQSDEIKSPVPKVTIKPIKPPVEQDSDDNTEDNHQVPCVTKINIKPIPKPTENIIEGSTRSNASVTKLNIKPILKPPEKINDFHRKSSSSEISESEYSENDETSTSDQASASDQGPSDIVPKVTIKLGKPGTESEGKFYTEKNIPKLTIKVQQDENDDQEPKLKKMVISQSEASSDTQLEKVPKLTIKTISKSESQPLSPKLTIKPLKPPDVTNKDGEIPKMKISTEPTEVKESPHVPKITIKPVTRSTAMCDSPEHIPVVTKLNIKPILKPTDSGEAPESFEDKVPVVSKLNIKPVLKPKDNDVDSSVDDVPKITKLNIKPIKNPEDNSSEEKDCDELNADIEKNSIPVVTKINIKPIIKPHDEETLKDSENQSSETGNSSDDNGDHIPVVTKLNIKPIVKPDSSDESSKTVSSSEPSIPVVTKLNIKPLIKPGESISPSSPKKEHKIDGHSPTIPIVTKLNIKPVLKPEDPDVTKSKEDSLDKTPSKNPPLVMKINMKTMTENFNNEHASCNNINEPLPMSPKKGKVTNALESKSEGTLEKKRSSEPVNDVQAAIKDNCVPDSIEKNADIETPFVNKQPSLISDKEKHSSEAGPECDSLVTGSSFPESSTDKMPVINATGQEHKNINFGPTDSISEANMMQTITRSKYSSVQNCTLLKKLLENKCSLDKSLDVSPIVNYSLPAENKTLNSDHLVESGKSSLDRLSSGNIEKIERRSATPDKINDSKRSVDSNTHAIQDHCDKANENLTKPLEITISDKVTNQSSGQDSPRIILKINKTDHGPSAKIITEEVKRPDVQQNLSENTQDLANDKSSKRLRSSRIVENTEKTPIARRNMGKRPSTTDTSPPQNKDSELSLLQSKRLKLGQLLGNKSLTMTPVTKTSPPSPTKTGLDLKQGVKTVNHSLLNNENCSKNGNSKLHNILSNLHAKQMQSLPYNNTNCLEKPQTVATDKEINASVSSLDAVETAPVENSHPELQEMIINENSEFGTTPEEVSQDPLEVARPPEESPEIVEIPKSAELTPQPKKRGRPRKLPVSEGAKPVTLPVPALEERPQRSLRLMRDRPAILTKPRGRGRGRGGRRVEATTPPTELETIVVIEPADEPEDRPPPADIDPTSSRIKLPRMTEALDKMPSACVTPLTSRRRNSSGNFSTGESSELKVVLENAKMEDMSKTPEVSGSGRGRGGRGSRGGRGRTPRGRGRGRGGGRGATYMKETMGIYGRVCGPATTTVQLFEEETCMMDDNATPAKPTHLLDEDSQSSVKSSTNESSKMKKSKFADLFDSNKVWTAADVKEYTWPPPEKADVEHKAKNALDAGSSIPYYPQDPDSPTVMMIQEQVAMFLGVKSFKRRYAELKRRTISGEERDYVLSITAVDASEVLDIMLSDYPHKYEEYRSYQRQRQLAEAAEEPAEEVKTEEKVVKVEMKAEKPVEHKPELPKIDPEKTRQDMAAAAIASASEWNARTNAMRRGACADLQSLTVQRARAAPPAPPRAHLRPPAGFYPHALLPGQYQHSYRVYTPDQLRYFPLNTVLAAPPAPPSEEWSSESEPDWGSRFSSSEDSDGPTHHSAKRKKLTKTKRSSQAEVRESREPREETREEDLCRVCKLRLEANRRYTHERFLVCANCNAKLHPSCLELSADTIRKCREYAWQCAECKTCCTCRQPADDDKMLFCDLCDRGFHIYCVGLDTVPSGRWHCVECAICKSCGARSPGGAGGAAGAASTSEPAEWHHQTRRGLGGHKVYSHSLCTPCARSVPCIPTHSSLRLVLLSYRSSALTLSPSARVL
ncbi:hypothetical protein HW555_003101, partial [Spodoptera exigua]